MADTEQVVGLNNDFEDLEEDNPELACKINAIAETINYISSTRELFVGSPESVEAISDKEVAAASADQLASLDNLNFDSRSNVKEWIEKNLSSWGSFGQRHGVQIDGDILIDHVEAEASAIYSIGDLEAMMDKGLNALNLKHNCAPGPAAGV